MRTTVAGILAVLGVLLLVLLSGITIPVGFLAGYLGSAAGQMLDRKVTIDGPILLTTSLRPQIAVGGLTIANPRSWPADTTLADIEKARVKISVIALLSGDIQIDDLEIDGASIRMVARDLHLARFVEGLGHVCRPA